MTERGGTKGTAGDGDREEPPPKAAKPVSEPVPKGRGAPAEPRRRVSSAVVRAQNEVNELSQSGERQAPLQTPSPERVLQAVIELSRTMTPELTSEDIAIGYLDALRGLLPARRFALRLLDPDSGELALVHATEPLRGDEGQIQLSQESVDRHSVPDDALASPGVRVVPSYTPVFEHGAEGFDVPLLDRKQVLGSLSVEYPLKRAALPDDRPLAVQMTMLLGSALRDSRLLRESRYLRDYLEKILDHANAPIVVLGREGEIQVVNTAFLALTGGERADMLGEDFMHVVAEEDRARLLELLHDALRGETTVARELHLLRRSGGAAHILLNTASVRDRDGEVESVIAIGQDLTEVRQLEEQVVQAEKLATLGQLAAGVVHELNNPLTSISVYSDYLLKKAEEAQSDPGDIEKLRRIVHSAQRILRFTRDLVAYARPSAEEPRLVRIHEILDQSVLFCEHVVSESTTTIEKSYAEDVPLVYGVKGQLHQVFINLITNACHAAASEQGRLRIETELTDASYVTVRISDDGVGIPGPQLDQVFEPFFSTKREGKGTGLGLSIVRNILRQHNGDIGVESVVGKGTTFEVTLPCPEPPHE